MSLLPHESLLEWFRVTINRFNEPRNRFKEMLIVAEYIG